MSKRVNAENKINTNAETKVFGIDIETHDPLLADKGAGWVFGEGFIIATALYDRAKNETEVFSGNGGDVVKNLLLSGVVTLAGANIVYDLGWLCYEHKIKAQDLKCSFVDAAIAEALVDEHAQYSLEALALKYLGERKGSGVLSSVADSFKLKGDFRKHLKFLADKGYVDEIKKYVASDAHQPVLIWEKQQRILKIDGTLDAALLNFNLIKIVLAMKQRGVRIDLVKFNANCKKIEDAYKKLKEAFEAKYGEFNFNSPKQLAAFFDRQGIPYKRRITFKGREFEGGGLYKQRDILKKQFDGVSAEKGKLVMYVTKQYAQRTVSQIEDAGYTVICNPSLDKYSLEALADEYDAALELLELKKLFSLITKFLGDNFKRFIVRHGEDNYRVHGDFNIMGARATGRFSSSNPNLQQIPKRHVLFEGTKDAVNIAQLCREIVIPDANMVIGKMDYSGQENRLMAHFACGAGSEEIRKAYNDNPELDFHDYMAEVSGLYDAYGKKEGRTFAKNLSFGLGYGMQLKRMMKTFLWTKEQAERVSALYHEGAPFVKDTFNTAKELIIERGYVITLLKRHLHLESYNGAVIEGQAYKAFNKLIQGSASDMMKKALVMLDNKGLLDYFPLYLTVHDELVFGIPCSKKAFLKLEEMQDIMEHTFPLLVPIRVDPDAGGSWANVEKYKENKFKFLDTDCKGCNFFKEKQCTNKLYRCSKGEKNDGKTAGAKAGGRRKKLAV